MIGFGYNEQLPNADYPSTEKAYIFSTFFNNLLYDLGSVTNALENLMLLHFVWRLENISINQSIFICPIKQFKTCKGHCSRTGQ